MYVTVFVVAHALCPTISAAIVSTSIRTRLSFLVNGFIVYIFCYFFLLNIKIDIKINNTPNKTYIRVKIEASTGAS